MPRWEPDAKERLVRAAGELFDERGYEHTTVGDIAQQAGLTRRSYFRHFADKREVLFAGSSALEALWTRAVADAPEPVSAGDAVAAALQATAAAFEDRRTPSARRQAIVDATPELQERERTKLADLARATAAALRDRGVEEGPALLAAEAGVVVLRLGLTRWARSDDDRPLAAIVTALLRDLRTVAADVGASR